MELLSTRKVAARIVRAAAVAFAVAGGFSACGTTELALFSGENADGGGGATDAASPDAASAEGGVADAAREGGASGCGDTARDPRNCGVCGRGCGPGQACVNGECACPPYQSLCDGTCVPTSADANDCGGCNVRCTGTLACASSACVPTCPAGLTACNNVCVDVTVDDGNCGGCGAPCASGTACVDGACVPPVALSSPAKVCANGGPPIDVGAALGGCTGAIAQTSFRWAICSCKDAHAGQTLLVDGYDSSEGPYATSELGASVGANGKYDTPQSADVWGSVWSQAPVGVKIGGAGSVKQELRVGGPLSAMGAFTIGSDAYVGGDVTGQQIVVTKTLHVPSTAKIDPKATYAALAREPVSVPAPCDCGSPGALRVADIVAAHAPPNDDDAAVGLAPSALVSPSSATRLDLPCGNYYLTSVAATKPVAIVAHGRAALYVNGDIASNTFLAIIALPGAELDVFVAGTLALTGSVVLGSPNTPSTTRVYVASTKAVTMPNGARLAAELYAGAAPVHLSGGPDVLGAIFAGDFDATQPLALHYDRAVLAAGAACPSNRSAADGGSACATCADCGNQACIDGVCGACGSSADCCAPLACVSGVCSAALK